MEPFLGTKNENGEVVDCHCFTCEAVWRLMLKDMKMKRLQECYELLYIPYDRLELDHSIDIDEPCYLCFYALQQFVICEFLEEFLQAKIESDSLFLDIRETTEILKAMNLKDKEEDPQR